jgi:renal tumor antigen
MHSKSSIQSFFTSWNFNAYNTEYTLIAKKGEGAFSEVLKGQSIKTRKYVAIKCMKDHFHSIEKVKNLREI